MASIHRVSAPNNQRIGNDGYLEYNHAFFKNFSNNLNQTQLFLDKKVGSHLKDYVSYKDGDQEKSIANAGTYGKGYVMINVKYARYQAYSPKIKKRVGLRGTYPFERMKADKRQSILKDTTEYARRLNNGH